MTKIAKYLRYGLVSLFATTLLATTLSLVVNRNNFNNKNYALKDVAAFSRNYRAEPKVKGWNMYRGDLIALIDRPVDTFLAGNN